MSTRFQRRKRQWTPPIHVCLCCDIEFPETTQFCPDCGRPTERGFSFRPMPKSVYDYRRRLQEKEASRRPECSSQDKESPDYEVCQYCRNSFPASTQFCSNCGRTIEKDA